MRPVVDRLMRAYSIATSAVGWALYSDDGRPVEPDESGQAGQIKLTDEESERARVIAERVVDHLLGDGIVKLADLEELELRELWLFYPRGTYSGTGAEIHTRDTLAERLVTSDVLAESSSDWTPVLERWSRDRGSQVWECRDRSGS